MPLDLQHYKNRHSLKSKIGRVLWNVTWLFLARWTPDRGIGLFIKWRILLLKMFGAKIGPCTTIMSSVLIWQPWKLEVGCWTVLSEQVNCYNVDEIKIGDRVVVSREAFLCTASHDVASRTMELVHRPISIGNDSWICARTFVGPGVSVGDGGVCGACAVVTHDVQPWSVVAGNPAKKIKNREFSR